MGRGAIAVLFAFAVALTAAGAAAPRGASIATQEVQLHMDDGVVLAATLYTPAGAPPPGGRPALVLFHGLGGKRQDLDSIAQRFASTFVVLTFDARGHGQSQGLVSIDGPREIKDTRAVFDWLAAQPGVDPQKIGAWGISLGGGAVLRSLVEGVPWAAVETVETWTDLYSALAPQDLSKSGAIYQFLNSVPADHLDPSVLAIKDDALASKNLGVLKDFAAQRSSRGSLAQVHTPVLLFQGRRDFAFDISQATAGYRLLAGPKELYVGDFGHSPSTFPGPDLNEVLAVGGAWFKRWLVQQPAKPAPAILVSPDPWRGKARVFKSLPATRPYKHVFGGANTLTGIGKATRTSGKLPKPLETFGAARVSVTAKLAGGWSRVVAVLTARTPKRKTIVVSEGGVNTASLTGKHALTIRLLDVATLIPRGSKLTLTLASSSTAQDPGNLLYLDLPMPPTAKVSLGPALLKMPVLRTPISR
ncbi:MAG TPA: alpha/beta fold hydrolase [Gaiellaceae bacterium]|nr:alpha/beta fold hydrolase [Gaiellaceae bacterium]